MDIIAGIFMIGIPIYICFHIEIHRPFRWLQRWHRASKQDWCDRKIAYDMEYDMWFEQHPFHECSLCRSGKQTGVK